MARQVGHIQWVLRASPDYIARLGEPKVPEDLSDHDCIAFEGLQTRRFWRIGKGAAARSVTISPRFSVNTSDAVIEAATAGLGIARVMSYHAAGSVSARRLVPLIADPGHEPLPCICASRSSCARFSISWHPGSSWRLTG